MSVGCPTANIARSAWQFGTLDHRRGRAHHVTQPLRQRRRRRQVYEGDAHGTNIFDGPHAAELEQRLIDFLRDN
jgi:hypothetical protein